jgi:hypothetical protein
MMKSFRYIKILVLVLILFQLSFGTGPKVGTTGAPQLWIPMGARNVAMAGADISNITGSEAMYWNPAGLGAVESASATFNYMNYFAEMNVTYLAAAFNAGRAGVLGISFQTLDMGSWEATTVFMPEGTGEMIDPNYMTVGLSYAKRFTDRILFGATGKVISNSVERMSATAFAADVGLQYVTPFGLSMGITLKNYGGKMQWDGTDIEFDSDIEYSDPNATTRKTKLTMAQADLPTSMNIGIGYKYQVHEMAVLNLAGAFCNEAYNLNTIRFGAEAVVKEMISLRGGYIHHIYPDDYPMKEESEYGLSMGAGLKLNVSGTDLYIDYAYRPMETFDANQYFAISFGL